MKNILSTKMLPALFLTVIMILGAYTKSNAVPLSVFNGNGWSKIADEDRVQKNGWIGPGNGGQEFDAEYLFYKVEGNKLSIGLQTGFNVMTGLFTDSFGREYYSGDLALSFDGDDSAFEYAVDFGLYTEGHLTDSTIGGNVSPGIDTAGVYQVSAWNTNAEMGYPSEASPFAMESGTYLTGLIDNFSGVGSNAKTSDMFYDYGGPTSYYRIVSFLTDGLGINDFTAHWTMSCGNDVIEGSGAAVPEPTTMMLLGSLATGLFGFAGLRRRFTK